jgi:hypothetical protein
MSIFLCKRVYLNDTFHNGENLHCIYAKRNIKRRFNGTFPCPNLSAPEKFYFEKLVPYWSFGNLKIHCQDLGELCLLNEIQLGCREAYYYCAPYEKDFLIPDLDFSHKHMLGDILPFVYCP